MSIGIKLIKNSISYLSSVKRARSALISMLYIAGSGLAPLGAANAVTTEAVKWHPGHYYMLVGPGKNNSRYLDEVYSEMASTPALRGMVVRFKWAELEPTFGAYDFSNIDLRLAELTSRNKRLIILLETKSSDDSAADIVPAYMKNGAYAYGTFSYGALTGHPGQNIKLWNAAIQTRLNALIQEMGKRYNSKANFEAFGLTESAMGDPDKPLSTAQTDGYYDNLLELNQVARTSFPGTMTFQYLNYPRKVLPTFVSALKNTGWALGCPDIFMEDKGLLIKGTAYTAPGVYNYYPDLAGDTPLTVQVEKSNYENTKYDKTGYKPSVSNLLGFAKNTLQVNYIFWTRSPDYYQGVLNMLNATAQKSTISGGLNAACPSAYKSCITN